MNTLCVPLRIYEDIFGIKSSYQKFFKHIGVSLIGLSPSKFVNYEEAIKNSLGLLLPGGGDIKPQRYNKKDEEVKYSNQLDKAEEKFYFIAKKYDKKVIGICRGLQIINVFENGTLKNIENHENINHIINYKKTKIIVNSFHHQAIDKLGDNLKIIATSSDNIIEAIESDDKKTLAFQFHPEKLRYNERKYFEKEVRTFLIAK